MKWAATISTMLSFCKLYVVTTGFVLNTWKKPNFIHKTRESFDGLNILSTSKENIIIDQRPMCFTAVMNITYDGSHFYGWSAGNDNILGDANDLHNNLNNDIDNGNDFMYKQSNDAYSNIPNELNRSRRNRRNRRGLKISTPFNKNDRSNGETKRERTSEVRSVQGVIQKHLAKLYGNVDPRLVCVEGCSRTDKGVHARSLIATFNCLDDDNEENSSGTEIEKYESQTENKHQNLKPIPFGGDVGKVMFCLNRMLPPDVRIMGIYALPKSIYFHPTLHAVTKTYQYTFSVGKIHNPMRWRHTWHLDGVVSSTASKTTSLETQSSENHGGSDIKKFRVFNYQAAKEAVSIFEGTHDFTAFKGAYRGSERKAGKMVNPICHILQSTIKQEYEDNVDFVNSPLNDVQMGGEENNGGLVTYTIEIIGDRFLYKMVRFIVGSIIAIGVGKVEAKDVASALHEKKWDHLVKRYIVCAPPQGLMLKDINYGENMQFDWITSNM